VAIPGRHPVGPAERSHAVGALCIAGLCLIGLALIWVVAALVPAAQLKDAVTLHDFTLLGGPAVNAIASLLLDLLDPALLTIWGLVLVLLAIARGRPRVALVVALVLALAPLSADALKPLLAHPHAHLAGVHIGPASWPSGHATAALALVLCAALVAPTRLRRAVAALGGVFAAAVGCALLIQAWHMPSDVIGGYMMAGLWMAAAVAGLRAADRRWPAERSRLANPSSRSADARSRSNSARSEAAPSASR
jgi:membrane-associated phospholipid phosphatase